MRFSLVLPGATCEVAFPHQVRLIDAVCSWPLGLYRFDPDSQHADEDWLRDVLFTPAISEKPMSEPFVVQQESMTGTAGGGFSLPEFLQRVSKTGL